MNQRVSVILIIALLVSAGATFLVYRAVSGRSSAGVPQTTMVVRAAHTLEIGALLKDPDLVMGQWVGPVPAGMATKKDGLLGRGVVATIYEGEPVMDNRLAVSGAGAGLAATIPAGMRAVAVRVNDIVGVAGFVLPGMRVDVLIAGLAPNAPAANGAEVKTVLQNIQVLSAGQTYQKDNEGKPLAVQVVNLLVSPEQAETLSLASNETRIQLILRNPLDNDASKTSGVNVATLFGGPKPAAPAAAPRPRTIAPPPVKMPEVKPEITVPLAPLEIEVFNGANKTDAKFPRPGGENK